MSNKRWLGAFVALISISGVAIVDSPAAQAADPTVVQILGINDFHGRIKSNGVEAGAAVLAGAVEELRTEHPDTVFAAAGDLIGASTFESFIAHDKPTIDALNAAGLEVSSVGNHEFDQGYDDLVDRVMAPYDATTNPFGGAAWKYLGANVRNSADNSPALPETWTQDFGTITVGFVGAVTDHLPELVSPAGLEGITVEAPVVAANRSADALKTAGADIVILLVHEGAATTDISSATDPTSDFGKIVTGANDNIDAIISGHTHLAYNHSIPVPGWAGRPVTNRPVVSAGQYGYNLNQLLFTVDDTDQVIGVEQNLLPLTNTTVGPPPVTTPNYPADPDVKAIVDAAVAQSAVLGAQPLGKIGGAFDRGRLQTVPGTFAEARGAESTLGNLVAEAQLQNTVDPTFGGAQIAFMNPGGLRTDMRGTAAPPYPATLTYQQAANVQPFANTLVNLKLTGAQIRTVLEQQWQPTGSARPFLRLGVSDAFHYTYDPNAATGAHIKDMWLGDAPISDTAEYSVTVNSFLAAGGDNFLEFANGTQRRDTGKVDLQGMVDYMAQFATDALPVDYSQKAVGISYPAGAPATYGPGEHVEFTVSSLAMRGASDLTDSEITVSLGSTLLGTFPVDNTITNSPLDEIGTASVDVVLPNFVGGPSATLTIRGATTGTITSTTVTPTPRPVVVVPFAQKRVFDTRGESGSTLRTVPKAKIGPGRPLEVQLTDLPPDLVPATGVGAVSLNVTVANPVGAGYITVSPSCDDASDVSSVNYTSAGSFVANAVLAPVSATGTVCFSSLVDTDLVVDVNGWLPTDTYQAIAPKRVFDTRGESGTTLRSVPKAQLSAGVGLEVQLTDLAPDLVPATGVGAVSLNVTVANPAAPGFIRVTPSCTDTPEVSSVNFTTAGAVVANAVVAPVSPTGTVCFTSLVDTDLVVDINGWFPATGFAAVPQQRVFDTRVESGTTLRTVPDAQIEPGHPLEVKLTDLAEFVPASGVAAVSLNVTATAPAGAGFVTVQPCDSTEVVSNVNFTAAGSTVANAVLAPVSATGTVCFASSVATDLVVDVNGWFASGAG